MYHSFILHPTLQTENQTCSFFLCCIWTESATFAPHTGLKIKVILENFFTSFPISHPKLKCSKAGTVAWNFYNLKKKNAFTMLKSWEFLVQKKMETALLNEMDSGNFNGLCIHESVITVCLRLPSLYLIAPISIKAIFPHHFVQEW